MTQLIGYYTTQFGELWDKSLFDLVEEAITGVLKQTELENKQINAVFFGNMLAGVLENNLHSPSKIAEILKINIPIFRSEAACASGGAAFNLAKSYLDVNSNKNVLVIGGGFIGVEFADELSKLNGLNVTLVEMLPHLLANSFDPEFSKIAENKLKEAGVNVKTGISVKEILGDQKVEKVMLSDGSELEIDAIILGVGFIPEVHLAREAGLECDKRKGIFVSISPEGANIFNISPTNK